MSISLHKSLNVTVLDRKVEPGWLMLVKCRIQDKVFVVGSVYLSAYNNLSIYREQLETLDKHIKALKCENVILMGDFNVTLEEKDSLQGWANSQFMRRKAEVVNPFLDRWEIQDVWCALNPHTCNFTRRTTNRGESRHLDYFFSSLNYMPYVTQCEIGYSYCSDHCPVMATLQFCAQQGKKRFMFPVDLCYSEQFKRELSENIAIIRKENFAANHHTLWELIKATVRSTVFKFKSLQSHCRKQIIEDFEGQIAKELGMLDKEPSPLIRVDHFDKIAQLNASLDSMFKEGRAIQYAANLARWYGERDKPTKYFLNKFKQDKSKPVITHLITNEGTVTQNSDLFKEAHQFYSQLYTKTEILSPLDHLDNVKRLDFSEARVMAEEISENELLGALKAMKPSSSPGSDGLTVKFYVHFWDLVKEDLLNCLSHSFLVGKMSLSQRQGLIHLLPKKKRNLAFISNWRPITLLNVDYKILAKLFAKRLRDILPDKIHPDQ